MSVVENFVILLQDVTRLWARQDDACEEVEISNEGNLEILNEAKD